MPTVLHDGINITRVFDIEIFLVDFFLGSKENLIVKNVIGYFSKRVRNCSLCEIRTKA